MVERCHRFLSRIRQYFEHNNAAEVDLQQTDTEHLTRPSTKVASPPDVHVYPYFPFSVSVNDTLPSHNTTVGRNIVLLKKRFLTINFNVCYSRFIVTKGLD